MKDFQDLPKHVQYEAKKVLQAYSKVYVDLKENDEYVVRAYVSLSGSGEYNEFIGEYKAVDIFSPEELIINYVKQFREFPHSGYHGGYKGKKDWEALRSDWKEVYLNQGNLVFK